MGAAHYLFAGGGTGGHLFPGIAVAQAVRRLDPSADITFLTTDRSLDRELLAPGGFESRPQPVQPFTWRPDRLPGFLLNWQRSVRRAREILKERRTTAVLGLGGYAAGPPVVAAKSLGVRAAILNPDAVPGRANKYLARSVDLIVLQWAITREHFPTVAPCRTLGCPIRPEFAIADQAEARRRLAVMLARVAEPAPAAAAAVPVGAEGSRWSERMAGEPAIDASRPLLVVTGASQGARTINQAMLQVWPKFVAERPEWQLIHLSGQADLSLVQDGYRQAGAPAIVLPFTHQMALMLAAADAVVSRAGASTLAELTALGKPSVLLPYPFHTDMHQRANAQVLERAGAAILVDDRRDAAATAGPLLDALRRVAEPAQLAQMGAAARSLARPAAANDVAAWLVGG